ncbi:MAG: ABC transporter ATP-binding protein/permease [Oscillospiraceae bacterium]|jgi:ATP-binding cassette subfamily B protein|nr:ABC transporter ATP-binding protein/permease [Oscillospiraceae bacterium]
MSEKKKKDKINFRNLWFMYREIWHVSKLPLIIIFVQSAANLANTFADVYFLKVVIDGITDSRPFSFFAAVVVIRLGVMFAYYGIVIGMNYLRQLVQLKTRYHFSMKLYDNVKNIDLASAENAEFFDKYQRAMNETETRAQDMINLITTIVSRLFVFAGIGALLVTIDPLLIALGVAASVVFGALNVISTKIQFKYNMALTSSTRGFDYIKRVFYQPPFAKDIRRTNLPSFMRERFKSRIDNYISAMKKYYPKILGVSLVSMMGFYLFSTGFVPLFLVYRVVSGLITIADYTMLTQATQSFSQTLTDAANIVSQLVESSLYIQNYIDVVTFKSALVSSGAEAKVDAAGTKEIRLDNVTFGYAGGAPVLNGVNLTVARGEKIAIVGENGAGKTTLVKLIMGLYDPTEGTLSMNGIGYRDINRESLFYSMSVVEQDLQCYALSIRENIALAAKDGKIDDKRVDAILERVMLKEKIDALPHGADTEYTKEFDEEGVEFSGGQLQRLAIARALYNESGLLIMDEPSSALDPLSEQKIYELINEIAEDKTLILISHRLSCVKDMDRIIVMDEGKIIEQGNHATLMDLGGKYFEMFTVQAERYGE